MLQSELHIVIFLPILAGVLLFCLPERFFTVKGIIAGLITAFLMVISIRVFQMKEDMIVLSLGKGFFSDGSLIHSALAQAEHFCLMNVDSLARLIVPMIGLFSLVIAWYSICYLHPRTRPAHYFSFFLITAGCANGAVLADHLLFFLFFWGILGLTLYMLIKGHNSISASAAKKTFILVGASDGIMVLGIALIWHMGFPLTMSTSGISTANLTGLMAFLCLLVGAFTKAGAFPFHTWVPDYSTQAPASSSAFLPASLDKLLGIYFLARLFNSMFVLTDWLTLLMLVIGVLTIIIGVMMALVQNNYKRLLGYHAVSQVGYMVTGFALGTPLGIAGGLFHLINNALYKSGLFLTAGHVERHTGRHLIEDLGGLSKVLPITFFSATILSLSIAGIPPLNGFASKWLIYQGIIDFGQGEGIANSLWVVWLVMAMFGSALTLASFLKFMAGIFLGPGKPIYSSLREKNPLLFLPPLLLALICIGLGVFASNWFIPKILQQASGAFQIPGIWDSSTVSYLVLISIVLGLAIFVLMDKNKVRPDAPFLLGEPSGSVPAYPAGAFYKTISKHPVLETLYKGAERKYFDVYDLAKELVLGCSKGLSRLHTGILPLYMIWFLVGLLVLLFIFI